MPANFADVTVVMPAYQAAATIAGALASIAGQTLKPREVIVVDDGSTDDTIKIVQDMASRMNGVSLRLFRQANQGAGAARNQALSHGCGAYFAFLDADDQWLPGKLEASMAVMQAGQLVMSSHNLFGVDATGEHLIDSRSRYLANPQDPYRTLFLRGFISSSTVVVRRDAALAAGGFDPALRSAQDYEFWLAVLATAGDRFVTFDAPLLRYTLAEAGITSQIDRKLACSLAILHRHMGILRGLPGPVLKLVLIRSLIIHWEAITGHRLRKRYLAALKTVLLFPINLVKALSCLPFTNGERPNFLNALEPAQEVSLDNGETV